MASNGKAPGAGTPEAEREAQHLRNTCHEPAPPVKPPATHGEFLWRMRDSGFLSMLHGAELSVFMALLSWATHRDWRAWPGLDGLVRATGLPRRSVQRALRGLEMMGMIWPVQGGSGRGRKAVWQLQWPPERTQAVLRQSRNGQVSTTGAREKASLTSPFLEQKATSAAPFEREKATWPTPFPGEKATRVTPFGAPPPREKATSRAGKGDKTSTSQDALKSPKPAPDAGFSRAAAPGKTEMKTETTPSPQSYSGGLPGVTHLPCSTQGNFQPELLHLLATLEDAAAQDAAAAASGAAAAEQPATPTTPGLPDEWQVGSGEGSCPGDALGAPAQKSNTGTAPGQQDRAPAPAGSTPTPSSLQASTDGHPATGRACTPAGSQPASRAGRKGGAIPPHMEPETVELIPGLPPKLRRRGENTVARLARLLVRRIPDIQANPISVITAAMRHVPEPAVIESAIADMDLAKLHEGMTVLQILVGAARAKLTRGAWVEATRVEMLEMGFPEDLCKAVMEASKRLCRSPNGLTPLLWTG